MASYDFTCQACGTKFELTVPMSEHDKLKDHPPACAKCGSTETKQLVSMFSSKPASSY